MAMESPIYPSPMVRLRATGHRRWCHRPSAGLHGHRSAPHGSGPGRQGAVGGVGYGWGPQMLHDVSSSLKMNYINHRTIKESTCASVLVWGSGLRGKIEVFH